MDLNIQSICPDDACLDAKAAQQLIEHLNDLAADVVRQLKAKGWTLALAESCTAGLTAAVLAAIPGASCVLNSSAVVYQTNAKSTLLGLDANFVARFGPVSREVTLELAKAARKKNGADIGCAITGWAGPTGGLGKDIVGTCYLALDVPCGSVSFRRLFPGSRNQVRQAATATALKIIDLFSRTN